MKGQIDIYYDEEGDFLEITIVNPPNESYCEDVNEDVFLRKEEETGEAIGIGILKDILVRAPAEINFSAIKT